MPTTPGGSNTYVPELTNQLVVSLSANPDSFPVNEYIQLIPVDKDTGLYPKIGREEAGRLMDTTGNQEIWADGQDAPEWGGELEEHSFVNYRTTRRQFNYRIGDKAADQASYDVRAKAASDKGEVAMRRRTQLAITAATTTGNYESTHVLTVASISGNTDKWDVSTSARSDIKRSLHTAAELIMKDSLNAVKPKDLVIVMSPGCAMKIGTSAEIVNAIIQSPEAFGMIQGKLPESQFGCPPMLYGYKVVIEDTYKVTSLKGSSATTRSIILPDATPFMCARKGSLTDGKLGVPSFSTHVMFVYEDMTVEEKHDEWNRVQKGRVVDDVQAQVAAPVTGVLFQAAVN
jgi:hypothetical protein